MMIMRVFNMWVVWRVRKFFEAATENKIHFLVSHKSVFLKIIKIYFSCIIS
jgi:hypothetical protein